MDVHLRMLCLQNLVSWSTSQVTSGWKQGGVCVFILNAIAEKEQRLLEITRNY